MDRTTSLTPWLAIQASCRSMKATPSTGMSAFGICSVKARIRVPRPPAKTTHCMASGSDQRLLLSLWLVLAALAEALTDTLTNRSAEAGEHQNEHKQCADRQ